MRLTLPSPDTQLAVNNIFGAPDGLVALFNTADGTYLLLSPLSVGRHTVNFGATFGPMFNDASVDTTYTIDVVAAPAAAPLPAGLVAGAVGAPLAAVARRWLVGRRRA